MQGGGHGVECRADGLGAVPYEEQFCQSFLGTLRCETGLCILVPAVLHRLFQRANRLQERVLIFNVMGEMNTGHNRNIFWIWSPISYTEIILEGISPQPVWAGVTTSATDICFNVHIGVSVLLIICKTWQNANLSYEHKELLCINDVTRCCGVVILVQPHLNTHWMKQSQMEMG